MKLFCAACLFGVLGAISLATAPVAWANTISFQQGVSSYSGTEDTFLNEGAPEQSYGALTVAIAGLDSVTPTKRTGLVRFNVTSLQNQFLSINSATLTLYQRETSGQFAAFDVGAFQIKSADGGWVQGTTDTDNTNTAGNPDWNHLSHDTVNWAGSAGMMTPDVDYVATPLSTVSWDSGNTASVTDKNNTPYNFSIPTTLIADWISGTNTGIMIQKLDFATAALAQYYSGNWTGSPGGGLTQTQIRPKLTIDYTPIPEPTGVALLLLGVTALHRRPCERRF